MKATYYVIQDWMLDLDLDLTEVAILAIINGFSQDGDSTFRGSWRYLERSAKCSRPKVARTLKRLVELGYIHKNDVYVGGVKFCEYSVDTGGVCETPPVTNQQNPVSGRDGGGVCERPNNKIDNAEDKSSANRGDNSAHARAASFDFKASLLEMGVSEQHAADWMAVRKSKKMTNTRTAFDRLKSHIDKACRMYGVTPDECVAFAASKDWGGFDSNWEAIKNITTSTATNEDDRVRRAYAAEEAKFKGDLHF